MTMYKVEQLQGNSWVRLDGLRDERFVAELSAVGAEAGATIFTRVEFPLRTVHDLSDYSCSETYNITQTDDSIKDGDLFVSEGGKVLGFLAKAWPVILYGFDGSKALHMIEDGRAGKISAEYPGLFEDARREAARLGISSRNRFSWE